MKRKTKPTAQEIANIANVSLTLVHRKLAQGKSPRMIIYEAEAQAQQMAQRHPLVNVTDVSGSTDTTPPSQNGVNGHAASVSFAEAQRRKEQALAGLRETELQQLTGELAPVEELRRWMQHIFLPLVQGFRALPAEMRDLLPQGVAEFLAADGRPYRQCRRIFGLVVQPGRRSVDERWQSGRRGRLEDRVEDHPAAVAVGAAQEVGGRLTRFDRLQLQVRVLAARIATLEAAQAARPAQRKRERALRPDDADMDERDGWWAEYLQMEMIHGHGRTKLTKAAFATRHGIPLSEFYRCFSRRDRRGIPKGSTPYLRIRAELIEASAKLKDSHGKFARSHIFSVKTAV